MCLPNLGFTLTSWVSRQCSKFALMWLSRGRMPRHPFSCSTRSIFSTFRDHTSEVWHRPAHRVRANGDFGSLAPRIEKVRQVHETKQRSQGCELSFMPSTRKKSELPTKVCARCARPFTWRKKWRNNWAEVRYCSASCRLNRHTNSRSTLLLRTCHDICSTPINILCTASS